MLPKNRPPTSPGEMLRHFLEEYGVTQRELANHLDWPISKVSRLCQDKQQVTAAIALCLSDAFGNCPEFWLNGQRDWDMWHALRVHQKKPPLPITESLSH